MLLFASIAVTAVLILLQSTVMHYIAICGVVPDLSLMAVVYLANQNGRLHGQSLGFAGGLIEDFLSLAPLGFHTWRASPGGWCSSGPS